MRMLLFGLFATSIWGGGHVYMGRRLIGPSSLEGSRRFFAWALLVLSALLPPMAMFGGRAGVPVLASDELQLAAFTVMGLGSVLFVFVIASDAFRGLGKLGRRVLGGPAKPDSLQDVSRRGFLTNAVNASLVGTAGTLASVGYAQARALPNVVEVDVPMEGLPDGLEGFRIAQISDVHVGPTIRGSFLDAVVDRVNELAPDVVAVTGDLIDGYVDDLGHEVRGLGRLQATHGAFFVTGNHEYYWNGPAWCRHVQSLGLTVLNNEHRVIEHEGAKLLLAGVTDHRAGEHVAEHESDPHAARRGAPACDVDVLLAHQPRSVYEASEAGYHLQISGHTHGGQYFPMNILVHLAQPYVAGLAKHRSKRGSEPGLGRGSMWIYVSRGTGYWGPPNRLGAPHEITLLRLRRA